MGAQIVAFPDVPSTRGDYGAILYVRSRGVMTGYASGHFGPDDVLKRAEMAAILVRMQVAPGVVDACNISAFPDIDVADWFARYICAAKNKNYINGYPDGLFRPGRDISVAEVSKLIALSFALPITTVPANPEQWYMPYVQALISAQAFPASLRSADQRETRGEIAQTIAVLMQRTTGDDGSIHAAPQSNSDALARSMEEAQQRLLQDIQNAKNRQNISSMMVIQNSNGSTAAVSQSSINGNSAQSSANGNGAHSSVGSQNSCIATCPDGYHYLSCTAQGPINYLVDPCANHRGSQGSSVMQSSAAPSSSGPTSGLCNVSYEAFRFSRTLDVNKDGSRVTFVAAGSGQPYYNTGSAYKPQVFFYNVNESSFVTELTNVYLALSQQGSLPVAGNSPVISGNGAVVAMGVADSGMLAICNPTSMTCTTPVSLDINGRAEWLSSDVQLSEDGRILVSYKTGCAIVHDRQANTFVNMIGSSTYCMSTAGEPKLRSTVTNPGAMVLSGNGRTLAAVVLDGRQGYSGKYALYAIDVAAGTPRLLEENMTGGYQRMFLSTDGRYLVHNNPVSGSNISPWIIRDLVAGAITPVASFGVQQAAVPSIMLHGMSGDAQRFLMSDGQTLFQYNRDTETRTTVYTASSSFDIKAVLSGDGHTVAMREGYDGYGSVHIWHDNGSPIKTVPTNYACPIDPAWN